MHRFRYAIYRLEIFSTVWYTVYKDKVIKTQLKGHINKRNGLIDPDELKLENLRCFFAKQVYSDEIRAIWKKEGKLDLIDWVLKIQQRRNAVHAFKSRDIGDFNEFFQELKNFLIFMRRITNSLPYPDECFEPRED